MNVVLSTTRRCAIAAPRRLTTSSLHTLLPRQRVNLLAGSRAFLSRSTEVPPFRRSETPLTPSPSSFTVVTHRRTMTTNTNTPDPTTGPSVHVALAQIRAPKAGGKAAQVQHMRELVREAATPPAGGDKPDMIVLGEMWNGQPIHSEIVRNAEPVPPVGTRVEDIPAEAHTCAEMAAAAVETGAWLLGGSIPERDGDTLYNTATVWSPEGTLVQTYRKTHLFDLCLPKMTYKESDTYAPGDRLATFDTPFGRFGLAICYDLRFAEIATIAARQGCMAVFYPAAFNTHTGPLHWELLQRARALDNQIYIATCSQARDPDSSYVVYGHSMAVSPMGAVVASTEADEDIVRTTFDPQVIKDTRAGIPLLTQRRFDLYADVAAVPPTAKAK